jgi:hypothetical protein
VRSVTNSTILSPLREHILRTLLYYDIFNYPLTVDEVFRFLGTNHVSLSFVQSELEQLVQHEFIFKFGDFFSIHPSEDNTTRRIRGNHEAKKLLVIAKQRADLIYSFPFVRAVLVSGSLSKGYMDEKSDIDFFIVTKPERLWIARTLLVLYKRMFLFNSHKYFCVNYFVDTDHLEIEEKNLFTATELATLIPLSGVDHYKNLIIRNQWMKGFFPNFEPRVTDNFSREKNTLKSIFEKTLDVFGGNLLENFFMRITLNRWEKLYNQKYSKTDFEVAFKTRKYVSKNHPNHYQRKIIESHNQKLRSFAEKHDIAWQYE